MISTIGSVAPAVAAITWDIPRTIGVVSTVATVFFLLIAVLACRQPSPVRIRWDLARMALSGAAIVVMAMITRVSTPGPAIGGAILAGVLLGSVQGWSSKIETVENRIQARRSAWGLGAWAIGVVVMQSAGVASRTGTLKLGQTISWFGLALLVGSVLGRQRRIANTRARTAAIASVIIAGLMLVGGPVVAAFAAAIDSDDLTQDDLCSVMPSDEGFLISRLRGDACDSERGDCGVAASEATTCITSRTLLFGSADEARDYVESRLGEGWTEVSGLGDVSAERWTDLHYEADFHRGRVFAFVLASRGQAGPALEIAREIDARLVVLLGEAATPPGDEGIDADPVGGPAPGVEEPDEPVTEDPGVDSVPGDSGGGGEADQDPFDQGSPVASGDEPVTPEKAAGQAIAGLIGAALVGLVSVTEAGGLAASIGGERRVPPDWVVGDAGGSGPSGSGTSVGSGAGGVIPPGGRTTTVYVTGTAAEAAIRDGAGSTVPIPGDQQWGQNASISGEPTVQTDRVGSHGVIRSVGPIVRGPDGQVSVAVEVDPFEQPPIDLQPITTPGEPPEMVPPRPPPPDEVAPTGDEPEPPPPPPVDEAPPIGEEPEPPPASGEGDRLTPQQIEGGINRGMGDFEDVGLDGGTRPGDAAGEEGVWVDMNEDGRPDAIATVGPDGTMVVVADTDGDGVADTIYVDSGAEGVPDTEPVPPPIDEEPPPPALDEEPPPVGDGESPPLEGEPPDAVSDVRLTPQEVEHIVRWGLDNNRSIWETLADLEAANQGAGGSGTVELPDWYQREAEDLFQSRNRVAEAPLEIERRLQERDDLRERIANLNRQAQHWTALEQASDVRFIGGLRDVAQQQANYDAARAELLGERARLEDLGGSEAEIQEVNRQLEAIEEDHELTMRSTGIVGEQPGDESGLGDHDQPEVAEVEPAEGIDRGTWFDRPARELERIARERDELLHQYRSVHEQLDDLKRLIEENEGGADR